jgi:hypothetical protein
MTRYPVILSKSLAAEACPFEFLRASSEPIRQAQGKLCRMGDRGHGEIVIPSAVEESGRSE